MDQNARDKRRRRIRSRVTGTGSRPRVAVYRSLRGIGVQVIDDEKGSTLVAVTTQGLKSAKTTAKIDRATAVGLEAAAQAQKLGITQVVFDRGGYVYHGRVKALAEALREGGLEF